jgi:Sec-independent protein translocase protein TatA
LALDHRDRGRAAAVRARQGIKAFKKGMSEDATAKAAAPEPSLAQKTIDHQPGEPSLKSRAQTEEKAEGSNV